MVYKLLVLDKNTWNHINVYKQIIIDKKVQWNIENIIMITIKHL